MPLSTSRSNVPVSRPGPATVSTATDLPTLESLRDEQRTLRAAARAAAAAAAAPAGPGVRARRGGRRWRRRRRSWCSSTGGSGSACRSGSSCSASAWSGIVAFLAVRAVRRWRASRLDELSLAVTLDRFRPGTGQQVADVLQLPDLLGRAGGDGLAGDGAAGRPAGERGPGRRPTGGRSGTGGGRPCTPRRCSLGAGSSRSSFALVAPAGGPAEPGALAAGIVRALAAADLPHRDGPGRQRPAAGPARRAVRAGGPGRPAADRAARRALVVRRPGRAARSCGASPSTRRAPEVGAVRERTAEGTRPRRGMMVATGPVRSATSCRRRPARRPSS